MIQAPVVYCSLPGAGHTCFLVPFVHNLAYANQTMARNLDGSSSIRYYVFSNQLRHVGSPATNLATNLTGSGNFPSLVAFGLPVQDLPHWLVFA